MLYRMMLMLMMMMSSALFLPACGGPEGAGNTPGQVETGEGDATPESEREDGDDKDSRPDQDPDGSSPDTGGNGEDEDGNEAETDRRGYFTGYDGENDFSILLPGFRSYKLGNGKLASIKKEKAALSEETIDVILEMIAEQNPGVDVSIIRNAMPREMDVVRITPLKPGRTTITLGEISFPGGGKPPGDGSSNTGLKLDPPGDYVFKVYDYSDGRVANGKSRYTKKGSGNLQACTSCHAGGKEGAPPHELGRVMNISDSALLEWVTTGELDERAAPIQHAWEFRSKKEEDGISAYLRTLQTNDMETLTRLFMEVIRTGTDGF